MEEKLFYSIGEVAKELNLEQHVLRFWESQFHQVKPMKRNGRRLYTCECIEMIKKIKHMLHDEGYTIKGAQKELKQNDKKANCSSNSENLLKELTQLRNYIVSKINSEENL